MVIQLAMHEIDRQQDRLPSNGTPPAQEFLEAENVSLRLLLAQAEIDAQGLLAQAGIEAREREAADKLQKLILEELHHHIKNTLATVSAIASQSRPPFAGTMDQRGSREDRPRCHRSFRQSRCAEIHDCGT